MEGSQQLQQKQNQQQEINFPKLQLQDFKEEQIPYLETLTKYSGRRSKLQVIDSGSVPMQKETFIKEHLTYMGVNEQVDYNDLKAFRSQTNQYSMYIAAAGFIGFFSYYAIVTPTTRSLLKETFKSLFLGSMTGLGYYKYRSVQYDDKLHQYYIMVLNRVHDRRRFQIDHL